MSDNTTRVGPDPTPLPSNALPPPMPSPAQPTASASSMTATGQATAPPPAEGPPRRRSSLFQSLIDQNHHPTMTEHRRSISDQHRTPGFFGKMWKK
ncbi:hypothetical protein BROUX41_004772 [Berkeleyomyces rouxiae]|uniref:uncharacterized protein n=1 Tax=Berkeleyomyces rouxiae TaxID=2035830 RepID=UPI003B78B632